MIQVFQAKKELERLFKKGDLFFLNPLNDVITPVETVNGRGISKHMFDERGIFNEYFDVYDAPVHIPYVDQMIDHLESDIEVVQLQINAHLVEIEQIKADIQKLKP